MSRHVLFVVHGMGVSDPSAWAGEFQAKLKEVAKRYEHNHFPMAWFEDNVIVVPVKYGDILAAKVSEWQADAGGLGAFAEANGISDHGVLDWLQATDTAARKFLWSHIAHVILYRFFPLMRERIRITVIRQFMDGIDREYVGRSECRCSVLAHSLGTAVAHDCLHILGSKPTWRDPETDEDRTNAFLPDDKRFLGIFMVANVSRLLQTDIDTDTSIVRTGPSLDPGSYCASYYDIKHILDPLPMPLPLAPRDWELPPKNVEVNHFRDWNIHSLEHYLDNPAVHIPLLRTLAGKGTIGRGDEFTARRAYEQFDFDRVPDGDTKDILIGIRAVVSRARDATIPADYLNAFVEFLKLADRLRECMEEE